MPAITTSSPKHKEGWLGVLFTAVLCGVFLWWWFLPGPVSADAERDPMYWIGMAEQAMGAAEPSLAQRMEIVMISEGLKMLGHGGPAKELESRWLPAPWLDHHDPSSPEAPPEAAPSAPETWPVEARPVIARLDQATAAFDTLDIEAGQSLLRTAATEAAALPMPARSHALWLVTARQARNGLASDAIQTRDTLMPAASDAAIPDWLVAELFAGDIVAPMVAACERLPSDHPQVITLVRQWRALLKQRLHHRDHSLLARHGAETDASRPHQQPESPALWEAVEANRLDQASAIAGADPTAHLAIARMLSWMAAPAQPASEAGSAVE
jgi:hypothetical protein